AMLDCKAAAPAQDQHEIRYESVVTEPEQTIRSLMDFLGEPFDPQQLAFYSGQHSRWHTDKRNAERLAAPAKSDAVGRWKAGLTPKDVRRIEAIAGEPMRALGYPPTTDSPTIRSAEAAIAKTITHPCSRLIGILHNREGFGYAARDLAWRLGRG
ncbi:MAG: sulfotransferase, partial [Planctomycetota bacterium]